MKMFSTFLGLLDTTGNQHLQSTFSPTVQQLLDRMELNCSGTTKSEYPPELRCFASTLQFYSSKAYAYVRQVFLSALPHPATIRKWYSNLQGAPGFSAQGFRLLEEKVDEMSRRGIPTIISIMMDDMSIRKQIDYDEKTSQFIGFVDIGTG